MVGERYLTRVSFHILFLSHQMQSGQGTVTVLSTCQWCEGSWLCHHLSPRLLI